MYRKNEGLACKNRANGWGGSAGLGCLFRHKPKSLKKVLKCLIFNGLLF